MTEQNGQGNGSSSERPGIRRVSLREMGELVGNLLMERQEFMRQMMDPRRNLEAECGYPASITPDTYVSMWEHNSIAARVVEAMPLEAWQVTPSVYEDEDPENVTPFEEAVDNLHAQLRGGGEDDVFFLQAEGSPLWDALRNANIQSRIGQFGGLLIGLDDGKDLKEPADMKPGGSVRRKLNFLRIFKETEVRILKTELDIKSRRFGQPDSYLVRLASPTFGPDSDTTVGEVEVHWTRFLHITEGPNEVYNMPVMKQVFYHLLDLKKLYGGSAEMYYRGAMPGWALSTHPQLGGEVEVDQNELKKMMEDYMNGLQRWLALMGMSVQSLAPQVVDPTPQIQVHIDAVCIKIAMPKRVFMGSERGELASGQDDAAWNDRVKQYESGFITSRIIVPFFTRLILLGVLPRPGEDGFKVSWPDLTSKTDEEKGTIASSKTTALSSYVSGNVGEIMSPVDFLTKIMGFTDDEANQIWESAQEYMREKQLQSLQDQATQQQAQQTLAGGPDSLVYDDTQGGQGAVDEFGNPIGQTGQDGQAGGLI